jgi:hypothetical protein
MVSPDFKLVVDADIDGGHEGNTCNDMRHYNGRLAAFWQAGFRRPLAAADETTLPPMYSIPAPFHRQQKTRRSGLFPDHSTSCRCILAMVNHP